MPKGILFSFFSRLCLYSSLCFSQFLPSINTIWLAIYFVSMSQSQRKIHFSEIPLFSTIKIFFFILFCNCFRLFEWKSLFIYHCQSNIIFLLTKFFFLLFHFHVIASSHRIMSIWICREHLPVFAYCNFSMKLWFCCHHARRIASGLKIVLCMCESD